jgi:hypothetical protein
MLPGKRLIMAARVLLVLLQFSVAWNVWGFFRTKHQLTTPLIPSSLIVEIASPILYNALVGIILSTVALVFFFFNKFWVVIIICTVALLLQQYYPYYFFN